MPFDAFISYSHTDKTTADAACATLESSGVRCWIAPRDVPPGSQWAGAIVEAIDGCRVMVLIFSSQANISNQIHREVERAVSKGIPIIPLRIEEVSPTSSMEYFLGSIHWLDALTPPLEKHLQRLVDTVRSCLDYNQTPGETSTRSGSAQPTTIPASAPSGIGVPVFIHQAGASLRRPTGRRWAALATGCVLIAAGSSAALFYLNSGPPPTITPATAVAVQPVQQAAAPPVDPQKDVPPVQQQTTTAPDDRPSPPAAPQQQAAFDEAAVRQLADKQKIPLPPKLAVDAPRTSVPARFADYFGAWGSEPGWNGIGRNAILIIQNIDEAGKATGILAQGPPPPSSPIQIAASFTAFTAPITSDGLSLTRGPFTFTFKTSPGDLMLGRTQGKAGQRPVDFAITLQHIPLVGPQAAVAPVDTPPPGKSAGSNPFDGQWQIEGKGGPSCPLKTWKKLMEVAGTEIRTPGQNPGRISPDGSFHFTLPSPVRPDAIVSYSGKLQDDAGTGTYKAIGHSCAGSITLKRI